MLLLEKELMENYDVAILQEWQIYKSQAQWHLQVENLDESRAKCMQRQYVEGFKQTASGVERQVDRSAWQTRGGWWLHWGVEVSRKMGGHLGLS